MQKTSYDRINLIETPPELFAAKFPPRFPKRGWIVSTNEMKLVAQRQPVRDSRTEESYQRLSQFDAHFSSQLIVLNRVPGQLRSPNIGCKGSIENEPDLGL